MIRGLLVLWALATLLPTGCSTSGGASARAHPDLTAVRDLRVDTRWNGQLAVLLKADRGGVTGAIFLGLAGAAMEQGIRATMDAKSARELQARVGDHDLRQKVEARVVDVLRESRRFREVGPASTSSAGTRLEVSVEHAGILPSFRRNGPRDQAQVGLHYQARVVASASGRVLWEIQDTCLHGEEHPWPHFLENPDLVRRGLDEATEELAHRLSNRLRLAAQPGS